MAAIIVMYVSAWSLWQSCATRCQSLPDTEFLQLAVQRRAVQVEDLRGFLHVVARAFERQFDGFAFDLFHGQVSRYFALELSRRGCLKVFGQVRRADQILPTK